MSNRIPTSRFGRALKAGIPVILAIAGAELIDDTWSIQRGDGLALSWSATLGSAERAARRSDHTGIRVDGCFGNGCDHWRLSVALPENSLGDELVAAGRTIMAWMTQDCPERRRQGHIIAML